MVEIPKVAGSFQAQTIFKVCYLTFSAAVRRLRWESTVSPQASSTHTLKKKSINPPSLTDSPGDRIQIISTDKAAYERFVTLECESVDR